MKHFMIKIMLIAGVCSIRSLGQALPQASVARVDVVGGFTAIRANAGPGVCGCFYMYGGSAEIATTDPLGVGLVFRYGYGQASNINGGSHNVGLHTLLTGFRYSYQSDKKLTPFGEALVGVGKSSTNYRYDNKYPGIAFSVGGGIDYRLNDRFEFRLAQIEYLQTHIPNGVNQRQNQLQMTMGIIYHPHVFPWKHRLPYE